MIVNDKPEIPGGSCLVPEIIIDADGTRSEGETLIVKEHFIDLFINEQLAAKLVCSPSNLPEMIMGRLKAEGYIQGKEDVETLSICEDGSKADVSLKDYIPLLPTAEQESTCGAGNQIILGMAGESCLKRLPSAMWKKEWVFHLANAFARESKIHKSTKGTHCCYLGFQGEILYSAEDIGRHNAMDKAIGYAVMHELDLSKCMLFTTGRIPTDMVKKAVGAGIPVLISKAVPTDQAIKMAKDYNLTLICKAWPDRFEIFNCGE